MSVSNVTYIIHLLSKWKKVHKWCNGFCLIYHAELLMSIHKQNRVVTELFFRGRGAIAAHRFKKIDDVYDVT